MDAFEALVSMLLRHEGYWTTPSFKVDLSKEEKVLIKRHSSPRWELDLIAYKGAVNEILAVECKSFLDSTGVVFRNGKFEPEDRYKLFTDKTLRQTVLARLVQQLTDSGSCAPQPSVRLCLAVGKLANKTDRPGLESHFNNEGWRLFDAHWLRERLVRASNQGYENDIAFVVSKILLKDRKAIAKLLQDQPADQQPKAKTKKRARAQF
jgi:hypothetical protein